MKYRVLFGIVMSLGLSATLVQGGGSVFSSAPGSSFLTGNAPARPKDNQVWWIEVKGAPGAEVWAGTMKSGGKAAATSATADHLRQTAKLRDQVRLQITAKSAGSASILYDTGRVLNGIAIMASPETAATFRDIDGVTAVRPLRAMKRNLDHSIPFIGVPQAWVANGTSLTGEGVRVGIIDTGIDYLHTDFGGPGTGYDTNDSTIIGDNPYFPGPRVVGGTDLVGDDYDGDTNNVAVPDPDPMDCQGHGTHVAGITGGSGVTDSGVTYAGPYDDTVPLETMKVAPGVAPKCDFYAIKVFGCDGSTFYVVQALEWAADPNGDGDLSDRLDVLNLSLGSPYGDSDDPESLAVDSLSQLGCLVACSAGNEYDTVSITGGPSMARRAVAVASSIDTGSNNALVTLADVGDFVAATAAFGPPLDTTGISGEVELADPIIACSTLNNPLAGKIAYIDRGSCVFVSKVLAAQQAGAIGAIIGNNGSAMLDQMGGTSTEIVIPSVMIDTSDAATLKSMIAAGTTTVQLHLSSVTNADKISPFSSRGPEAEHGYLKPDVCAPGSSIDSAAAGSGTEAKILSGTSMASPHVAGLLALLREDHPDWTSEEIKAVLMSTSTHDITTEAGGAGSVYPPQRVGSGRIDALAAVTSPVFMHNTLGDGTVSIGFGRVPVATTTLQLTRTVEVVNRGASQVVYDVSYVPIVDLPGVDVTPDHTTLQIGANRAARFDVVVTIDVAKMDKVRDASMTATQVGSGMEAARDFPFEEAGYLVVSNPQPTPDNPTLRLGVYVQPQPTSDMRGDLRQVFTLENQGTITIPLSGTAFDMGSNYPDSNPLDSTPFAYASELLLQSPDDPSLSGQLDATDLKTLGLRVYRDQDSNASLLEFAITTYGTWGSPNQIAAYVDFDLDGDGNHDSYLVNANTGNILGSGSANDCFYAAAFSASSSNIGIVSLDMADPNQYDLNRYGTNAMILAGNVSYLGMDSSTTYFRLRLSLYHNGPGLWGEATDWIPVDISSPGLAAVPSIFHDVPSGSVDLSYDRQGLINHGVQSVLLVHKHNALGNRAQIIPLAMTVTDTWMLH